MLVVLSQFLKSTLFKNLSAAVVILVIGVLIIRVLMRLIEASLNKSRLEKAAHSLILSLSKAAMYILLFLIAASTLGIDVSSIVALASVLTLALSLSLQNMVSNIIGGFTILYTHPFHSGDYVEIAGQGGTVREELIRKFGPEICRREHIVIHDCQQSPTVDLGVLPSGAPLRVNALATWWLRFTRDCMARLI